MQPDAAPQPASAQAIIGGVAVRLGQLPMEDIRLVAQMVARLQQQRQAAASHRLSPAEIVTEARRRAVLSSDVSRAEIAARFEMLAEETHKQATSLIACASFRDDHLASRQTTSLDWRAANTSLALCGRRR